MDRLAKINVSASINNWLESANEKNLETPMHNPFSPKVISNNPAGYVKSIIEKFQKFDVDAISKITIIDNYTDNGKTVDCRIEKTPRPNFVEKIYLTTNENIPTLDLPDINVDSKIIAENEDTASTKNLEAGDITNGNVIVKSLISVTPNDNESDENGNNLLEELLSVDAINESNSRNLNESNFTEVRMNEKNASTCKIDKEAKKIESMIDDRNNDNREFENIDKTVEISSSLTEKRFTRQDSVVEVISGINADIMPSKIVLNVLPESDTSVKYNLDAANMNLIYSLTPKSCLEENCVDDGAAEIFQEIPDSVDSPGSSILDEVSEFIWQDDLMTSTKRDEDNNDTTITSPTSTNPRIDINESLELLDSSFENNRDDEWDNEGHFLLSNSDNPELPPTMIKLADDDESFEKDISTSANEIIAHLDAREILNSATDIVNDLVSTVSSLNITLPLAKSIDEFMRDIRESRATVGEDMGQMGDSSHPLDTMESRGGSTFEIEGDDDDCADEENLEAGEDEEEWNEDRHFDERISDDENSVIVIDEIVHHILDKFPTVDDERIIERGDSCNSKRFKECTNIEILKEMHRDDKNEDEVVLEFRSLARTNSDGCGDDLELNLRIERDENLVEIMRDDAPNLSIIVPMTEVTSESTENDTKSDNSKENNEEKMATPMKPSNFHDSTHFCLIEYDGVQDGEENEENDGDEGIDFIDAIITTNKRDVLSSIPEESANAEISDNSMDENSEKSSCDADSWNATYTISDCSDVVDPGNDESLYCAFYNADVSSSMDDDTRQTNSGIDYDEAFDTTANYADESTAATFSNQYSRNGNSIREISSQVIEEENSNEEKCGSTVRGESNSFDCMTCSYETNEFIRLERQLMTSSELEITNTCARVYKDFSENSSIMTPEMNSNDWRNIENANLETSPLKAPPRYEDTTLYRVVSRITLTDTITSNGELTSQK